MAKDSVIPGVISAPVVSSSVGAPKSNGSAGMPSGEINPFAATGGKMDVKSGGLQVSGVGHKNGHN